MDWPWWFRLGMALLLVVIVVRYGRWFLELFRAQREGRMDPDALWPPGRTEGTRQDTKRPDAPRPEAPRPDAPRRSDFPTRDPLVDPFDPDDLGRPGSPDGPPA